MKGERFLGRAVIVLTVHLVSDLFIPVVSAVDVDHDNQMHSDSAATQRNQKGTAAPEQKQFPPLLADIEHRTFRYFWETTNPTNGLAPDRYPSRPFASVASIGFALTAYPIGVENHWITRKQAIQRTLVTLRSLRYGRSGPNEVGRMKYRGFYYHFLDLKQGNRYDRWVELSSIDTALLMMGVLFAQSYYTEHTAKESEIRYLAEKLYQQVEWPWMQPRPPLIAMGWYPKQGFIAHDWSGYNEGMMLYILALGSPSHPIETDAWDAWTASYGQDWGVFEGQRYLSFGPLFAHQYTHAWIDFREIQDKYMRSRNMDYQLNSRRAALAQRDYAIENLMKWKDYGENVWGITACDGPQETIQQYEGEQRHFYHYRSRGAGLFEKFDDGTLAPTALIGSIAFAPEFVIPATAEIHKRYGDFLYSSYGFLDAFNPSFNYPIPLKTGQLVAGRGWVASDYIGIDQGTILLMIANYRNSFVWDIMKKNQFIRRGLLRAGFQGGWLLDDHRSIQNNSLKSRSDNALKLRKQRCRYERKASCN